MTRTSICFFSRKDELTVHNGCLLRGMLVIVLSKLREQIRTDLHVGHIGVVKMKALARSLIWWPGLDAEIEAIASKCARCQEYKRAPPAAPIHPWEWLTRPWERIHIDFAGPFLNSMFLVAVDAHSKWPEVVQMRETNAERTIEVLRGIFSRTGVRSVLVSDNGPQFTSIEFARFTKGNGIKHVTSAPYHPSSNGLAERFVQSFKSAMKASKKDEGSVQTKLSNFLFAYRNAAHATTGESPAKLFIGRTLPSQLDLLKPNLEQHVKNKQFDVANRRSSVLRTFEPGQTVIVRVSVRALNLTGCPEPSAKRQDRFRIVFKLNMVRHGDVIWTRSKTPLCRLREEVYPKFQRLTEMPLPPRCNLQLNPSFR